MDSQLLKNVVEAALLAAGGPLTIDQLRALFGEQESNSPERTEVRDALKELQEEYESRGIEIREVASGFRVQVREGMSQWLTKLWEERAPRYSRALMETLAIIAYRQPVTRGDIEEIRGVSVTSNIIRTLLERDWIKVVGHRDVPGKPAMFGSTRGFLDYFGLKKLDDLPPLAELAAMEPVALQLQLGTADQLPMDEQSAGSDSSPQVEGDAQAPVAEDVSAEDFDDAADSESIDVDGTLFEVADEMDEAPVTESTVAEGTTSPDSDFEQVGQAGDEDNDASNTDVAPGAVVPLVGLNAPGDEHQESDQESATIASLDDARAAAADALLDTEAVEKKQKSGQLK